MTRTLQLLFHQSPYWGWIAAAVLLLLPLIAWLLVERFAGQSRSVVRWRSTFFTAFVVLDLMVLIVLGSLHVARIDLTRDKLFSLSPVSRELVAKLDDTVTVEVFFPEDVPPEMVPLRESLADLLDEYRAAAGGQVVVRYLDPKDAGVGERAKAIGIEPKPYMALEAGTPVTKEVMRGMAVTYKGRTERIPAIDREVGLEYQITTLLRTLTGKPIKLGILTGHKELQGIFDQPQALESLKNVLAYHEVVTVNLEGGAKPVPADVQALLMSTPTDPLVEAELYQLDQFVMRGGALAFFGNGFTVVEPPPQMQMMGQMQMPEIKPLDAALDGWLAHLGVQLGDDVVLSDAPTDEVPQQATGLRITRGGSLEREYAKFTAVFSSQGLAEGHPVTFGIDKLTVFQSSTVDLSEAGRGRMDTRSTTLLRSSEHSWLGSSSEVMFPMALGGMPPQEPPELRDTSSEEEKLRAARGPRPLMVALEGNLTSYFAGKEAPTGASVEERKDQTDLPVRILVLGSHVPLIPRALERGLAGDPRFRLMPNLLLNTVDWLLSEHGLLEVRGKSAEPPPFKAPLPDDTHQKKFTWLLTLGWPAAFVALSLGAMVLVRAYRRSPGTAAARREARADPKEKDKLFDGSLLTTKEAPRPDGVSPGKIGPPPERGADEAEAESSGKEVKS
ncbi:MAG: GldG family protein [Deltaproteobacteria bacterium]|nr:GldG family protein [Deltaproteobacteria bacterium]